MERKEVPGLYFSKEEQQEILRVIGEAERKTSAEIIVRLERNCPGDPIVRCRDLMQSLGITNAPSRSGVILYVSLEDHKVAVFGDTAVDEVMGQHGWETICDQIVQGFRQGKPAEALMDAIRNVADRLAPVLPYRPGDVNEFPDELSTET